MSIGNAAKDKVLKDKEDMPGKKNRRV